MHRLCQMLLVVSHTGFLGWYSSQYVALSHHQLWLPTEMSRTQDHWIRPHPLTGNPLGGLEAGVSSSSLGGHGELVAGLTLTEEDLQEILDFKQEL